MPNDAAGTTWNEAEPALTDPRYLGQQEIRGLRTGVRLRSEREHETYAGSSAGGEHRQGSAKAYRQATAPTLRPDGTTALGAADEGRLWVDEDNEHLYVFNGSAFTPVMQPGVPTDITIADFIDADGWLNNTGLVVFVYMTVVSSGPTLDLEYNHAGGGFIAIGNYSNTLNGQMTAIVAPNARLRLANAIASNVAFVRYVPL